jgi:hypothetical protein
MEFTAVLGSQGTGLVNRFGEANVILKDFSFEVHGRELTAFRGSKGTGSGT